jgi:hypothetical protein
MPVFSVAEPVPHPGCCLGKTFSGGSAHNFGRAAVLHGHDDGAEPAAETAA